MLAMLRLLVGSVTAAPPHITFFLVDDLGWNDVSMHGSKQIPTPNIDGLASSGIRLNNYYVNPVCSPTRASLMSGRSIIHHGIYTPYGQGQLASGLNLSYTILPQHLKASCGKWHLGIKSPAYLDAVAHRGRGGEVLPVELQQTRWSVREGQNRGERSALPEQYCKDLRPSSREEEEFRKWLQEMVSRQRGVW